jgi:rare lipoprotein A
MRGLAGVVLLVVVSSCSVLRRRPEPPPVPTPAQTAMASWYGRDFHGDHTASGERFDQGELTAAHPTLPIGTRVRVTNLANGRSVVVRINDRGPFTRGRMIDVSHRAAHGLGMLQRGTARVRIEVVDGGPAPAGEGRAGVRRAPRRHQSPGRARPR